MSDSTRSNAAQTRRKAQAAERRAWIRYPRRLAIQWQIFGAKREDSFAAETIDVSMTGAGILMNRSFAPGTILSLHVVGCRDLRTLMVRVKQCRPMENGMWNIGTTFVVRLAEPEMDALLDHPEAK